MNNSLKVLLLISILVVSSLSFKPFTKHLIQSSFWPEENYHGWVSIDETKKESIFYWWMPSRRSRDNDPVILWLTGGPGCSSELALFVENEPR